MPRHASPRSSRGFAQFGHGEVPTRVLGPSIAGCLLVLEEVAELEPLRPAQSELAGHCLKWLEVAFAPHSARHLLRSR
jgi:hypothetical protein